MSNTTNTQSAEGHNGVDALPQLQSTFGFSRRPRPSPITRISTDLAERVPLKASKIHRKESRGGLRGIFHRTKAEKSVVSPVVEEPMSPTSTIRSPNITTATRLPQAPPLKTAPSVSSAVPPRPTTPAGPTAKSSKKSLKPSPIKPSKPTPKPSPKSTKNPTKRAHTSRTSPTWDPPPLFQAYPQAVKHAQLPASTLSADSILRVSNHKRNHSLRDEVGQLNAGAGTSDQSPKKPKKHRRQISGSVSKADWTQKIFVLVTSGYLLQYAGEGPFDRLPEKMMQLGKDSVAFASDVIPGKHWVLQISQAMDADGTPASDSRSLLSRLAFRGADYRRSATSLLLVLNGAEEMDSWLAVLRREIEALGGKKHASETGKPVPDEKIMHLKQRPSHRFLVQRNPTQFSNPNTPQESTFSEIPWGPETDHQNHTESEDVNGGFMSPTSTIRPSTGYQSVSNSIVSRDEQQLESLRDGTNRYSYMSSGQRTLLTTRSSSPTSSPTQDTFDESLPKFPAEDVKLRPNAAAINDRRRSMQTVQVHNLEVQPKNFRHSTYGGPPAKSLPNRSLGTPNFSVPNSSSKRYSSMKGSAASQLPMIVTTFLPRQDSLANGVRKLAPSPLTLERSSPRDVLSPELTPQVVLTTDESPVDGPTPLPIINPSPRGEAPARSQQMSSLAPISPVDPALDFQFPRKFSSTQTLRSDVAPVVLPPAGPLPPPPTPRSISLPMPASEPSVPISNGSALAPALPSLNLDEEQTSIKVLSDTSSTSRVVANTKTKMRRPLSMQASITHPSTSTTPNSKPALLPSALPRTPRPLSMQPQSTPRHSLDRTPKPFRAPPQAQLNTSPSQTRKIQNANSSRPTSMQLPLIYSQRQSLEISHSIPFPPPGAPLPLPPTTQIETEGIKSPTPSIQTHSPPLSARQFSITSSASSETLNCDSLPPTTISTVLPATTTTTTTIKPTPFKTPQKLLFFPPSTAAPKANTTLSPSTMIGSTLKTKTESLLPPPVLISRRSMPLLVNSPPPAPPPQCGLPPLPSPGTSLASRSVTPTLVLREEVVKA